MEKIVSISALLEKDAKLVEKLKTVMVNDAGYEEVKDRIKAEIKYIVDFDIKFRKRDIEMYGEFYNNDLKNIEEYQQDVKNHNGDDFYLNMLKRAKNDAITSKCKKVEAQKELACYEDTVKSLQRQLDLTREELIDELKKQLAEVRAEISKQLNLKV